MEKLLKDTNLEYYQIDDCYIPCCRNCLNKANLRCSNCTSNYCLTCNDIQKVIIDKAYVMYETKYDEYNDGKMYCWKFVNDRRETDDMEDRGDNFKCKGLFYFFTVAGWVKICCDKCKYQKLKKRKCQTKSIASFTKFE